MGQRRMIVKRRGNLKQPRTRRVHLKLIHIINLGSLLPAPPLLRSNLPRTRIKHRQSGKKNDTYRNTHVKKSFRSEFVYIVRSSHISVSTSFSFSIFAFQVFIIA